MAKGVNKVILLGNVGKDPEIRTTPNGMTIASFSLATADRAKDQQGNWQDKTEWHNLVAFNRTAEIIRAYVKKGTQILVNEMSLLGGGPRGEGAGAGTGGYSRSNTSSFDQRTPASQPDYADQ